MQMKLKYGAGYLPLQLPDALAIDVFEPRSAPVLADPVAALNAALDSPFGCMPLEGRDTPASVAIAIPDETRPFPVKVLLPALLDRLFTAYPALSGDDICIVVGGGLHPPADDAQLTRILPHDLRGCRVVAHDAEHSPVTDFGRTSRGTPVEINSAFATADLKIVMGLVDAHQFVGFTGGAKGVTIGCASARMIAANHKMLRDSAAVVGNVIDNPVRLDLNEAGELAGVSLAINVVLDAAKKVVALLCGIPSVVMREASVLTADLYGMPYTQPYDIVIASCGGLPKDICLYQAQKGLTTATQCAAPGAKIILLAKCEQGIGDEVYQNYVRRFKDDKSLKAAFEQGDFAMGAHKAYLFARITTRFTVVIHSDLSSETLAQCLLTGGELQETVDAWLKELSSPRIAVIQNANSSFFKKASAI
ncbi:nickel-dependent lactate racemase [Desulfovibrio sp. OttesenSCG-928-G15]|nr:nickel-dependent lactate racemase [Desulfovibrio sp. OttesenSCG-928-G15]